MLVESKAFLALDGEAQLSEDSTNRNVDYWMTDKAGNALVKANQLVAWEAI